MKKIQLIKRLTNQGYNFQVQAINAYQDFLKWAREEERLAELERQRQAKEKDRILRRVMDVNTRMQGQAYRQIKVNCEEEAEKERALVTRQRGIMRRIVNSNVRLMGMGYNKLIEEYKAKMNEIKNQMKFIIKSLGDQESRFLLQAYNGLKERANMLNGVGMGDAQQKKVNLIKRLTNKGYNMQVLAINAYKDFLYKDRERQRLAEEEEARRQKEKDRILRRVCDTNLRLAGQAYRQIKVNCEEEAEKERVLIAKQRGIARRIIDSNTRLMGMGYNKLVEEHKARTNEIKNQLRFVIKSLTDKDARNILQAYNSLKERCNMLNGIGCGQALTKKTQLIRRLTDQGYNFQVMAINACKDFLYKDRERQRLEEEEEARRQKEKDRILRRVMDVNCRLAGQAYRQISVNAKEEAEKERNLIYRQRGILRRIINSNMRLLGMGWNTLMQEHKERKNYLREKMKFILRALGDKEENSKRMAYNGLKEKYLLLTGVGLDPITQKKIQLIKRLTNKSFDLQCQAINAYMNWLQWARAEEKQALEKKQREDNEKRRILRRVCDVNARMQGQAYRMIKINKDEEAEKERVLIAKQRGILRRIIDSNVRLMGMGYNKLVEEHKARTNELKN